MITFSETAAAPAAPVQTIVERMAETMRDMRAAGQVVTARALAVYGDYTDAEVERYAPEASDLARARAVREVA